MKTDRVPDPLVDEVRAARRELSERFDNDVDKLCDYLESLQERWARRLVKRPGKSLAREERAD